MTSPEHSQLLTSREVARAHGVHVATVIRWAHEGRIPNAGKMPGRTGVWLFPPEALKPPKPAAGA